MENWKTSEKRPHRRENDCSVLSIWIDDVQENLIADFN